MSETVSSVNPYSYQPSAHKTKGLVVGKGKGKGRAAWSPSISTVGRQKPPGVRLQEEIAKPKVEWRKNIEICRWHDLEKNRKRSLTSPLLCVRNKQMWQWYLRWFQKRPSKVKQ